MAHSQQTVPDVAAALLLRATGAAPGAAAIGSALDLLEARAQFDAPERAVNMRIAEHAGRLYLDLADEHWRAVAIDRDGWKVVGCPPVRFRRSPGMLPLPIPKRGGSIEGLRPFLNLSNDNDFVLVITWLLAAVRPSGPYLLLAISGEQGSAKTVLSKLLRSLLDPNVAPVRALPRERPHGEISLQLKIWLKSAIIAPPRMTSADSERKY